MENLKLPKYVKNWWDLDKHGVSQKDGWIYVMCQNCQEILPRRFCKNELLRGWLCFKCEDGLTLHQHANLEFEDNDRNKLNWCEREAEVYYMLLNLCEHEATFKLTKEQYEHEKELLESKSSDYIKTIYLDDGFILTSAICIGLEEYSKTNRYIGHYRFKELKHI